MSRPIRSALPAELLSPEELAEHLGVAPSTLQQWRWRGTGPRFRKLTPGRSGRVRYSRADVDAWMASRHQGGGL